MERAILIGLIHPILKISIGYFCNVRNQLGLFYSFELIKCGFFLSLNFASQHLNHKIEPQVIITKIYKTKILLS